MADKPLPDDRQMLATLDKLKAYTAHKGRQSQTPPSFVGGPGAVDSDLQTVETWANDANDDGAAWGQKKKQESQEKIRDSDAWKERVRQDEKDAAEEADFRSKFDMNQAKDEMKKTLDDHVTAMQGLADAGEPGFKGKLAETKQQVAQAKKFIDQDMEKALDEAAKRTAEQRRQRKATAQNMEKRGEEGKKWQADYGDQPGQLPAGQQADVQAALDNISAVAGQTAGELQSFGARAAPHIEALKKVQDWAAKLKPQVDSKGPALQSAKTLGKSGAAEARDTFTKVEAFEGSIENEASEGIETFRRWTDENNRLAKEWINSSSAKHREWAQAWMKTQGG